MKNPNAFGLSVPKRRAPRYDRNGMATACDSSGTNRLLRRARDKDQQAFAELFARCRERLRRTVRLRLDRRLRGRFQSSTVLQMVYEDAGQRFPEYLVNPTLPFFLWLRL